MVSSFRARKNPHIQPVKSPAAKPPIGNPSGNQRPIMRSKQQLNGGAPSPPPNAPPVAGKTAMLGPNTTKNRMMADGGFGAPEPIGGPPPAPALAPGAPPAPAGGMEPDGDEMGGAMVSPEAVNYHDHAVACHLCSFMDEAANCSLLMMQINPEGGCNGFKGKATEQPEMEMGGEEGGMPPDAADTSEGQPA